MEAVKGSVPVLSHLPSLFSHYSLRSPLAEAFRELKAVKGWRQGAAHLLNWSPQTSPVCQMDRSECECVCTCARARVLGSVPGTVHLRGQGQAGLAVDGGGPAMVQEPSPSLGLPCPCWACQSAWEARPDSEPGPSRPASVRWFQGVERSDLGTGTTIRKTGPPHP